MTDSTPTMEQIRSAWQSSGDGLTYDAVYEQGGREFDAALAARDAEVAANALREAADLMRTFNAHPGVAGWLRDRADRIEREATNHKPGSSEGSAS